MDVNAYRFLSRWNVPGDRELVYEVLADLGSYPQWWPQVRSVEQYDDETALVVVRSFLPYALRVLTKSAREDRDAGVLEARLSGDVDGWSRWTVPTVGAPGPLVYEQVVVARRELLRRLGPAARPFFRLNHAVMMSAGERGLRMRVAAESRPG